MLKMLIRYSKFFFASLLGSAVDCLVLLLCSEVLFHTDFFIYGVSPVLSYECGILVDFVIYYFFVWNDRISHPGLRSFFRHLGPFHLSNIGAFLCKTGALILFAKIFHCHVVLCEILGLCVSGLVNFTCNELLIFRKVKK